METFGYDIKIGAAFDLYFSEYFLLDFAIGTQIVPGVEDFLEKTGEKECPNTKKQDDYLNFIQPYIGVTAYFRL
jgi:hypothetical protein